MSLIGLLADFLGSVLLFVLDLFTCSCFTRDVCLLALDEEGRFFFRHVYSVALHSDVSPRKTVFDFGRNSCVVYAST
jgi:hypothetical protein